MIARAAVRPPRRPRCSRYTERLFTPTAHGARRPPARPRSSGSGGTTDERRPEGTPAGSAGPREGSMRGRQAAGGRPRIGPFGGGGAASAAASRTDTVLVINGDRLHGEVRGLNRGQLEFSTASMSTVYVEWDHVVEVISSRVFEVRRTHGGRYVGQLAAAGPGKLGVVLADGRTPCPRVPVNRADAIDRERVVAAPQRAGVSSAPAIRSRAASARGRSTPRRHLSPAGLE